MAFAKLVRRRIPDIIRTNGKGEVPVTHEVSGKELINELLLKGVEEANELFRAQNSDEERKEIADLLLVIRTLMRLRGYTPEEIEEIYTQRTKERGPLEEDGKGTILIRVDKTA